MGSLGYRARAKKPLEKAYKDLFKIAQQLEQSSEEYELLLGVCYLTWNHEGTEFRHLLFWKRLQ